MVRSILLVRLVTGLLLLVAGSWGVLEAANGAMVAAFTNLEQLSSAAADAADSVLASVDARDTLCFVVAAHPAAWLVEQALVDRASASGRPIRRCAEDEPGRVQASITSAGIAYRATSESGRLERTATLGLAAVVPESTAGVSRSTGLRSLRFSRSIVDTIDASDTARLGSPGYAFTGGVVVDSDGGSFWSRVLEPAVVLAAAAIAAILLFSVRSQ